MKGEVLWLAEFLNPSDSQSQEKIYPLPLRHKLNSFWSLICKVDACHGNSSNIFVGWVWWGLWGIRLWKSKHSFVPWGWSDFPPPPPSLHIWKGSCCFCSSLGRVRAWKEWPSLWIKLEPYSPAHRGQASGQGVGRRERTARYSSVQGKDNYCFLWFLQETESLH